MTSEEVALSAKLTANASRLDYNIRQMADGLNKIREALVDIHKTECWRVRDATWTTFEEFCEQRLQMNRSRAYQIIRAENSKQILLAAFADTPDMLSIAQKLPEGALREISALPPERMVEVVVEAVKTQGKATGPTLKRAKANLTEVKSKAISVEFKVQPKISTDYWLDLGLRIPAFRYWWDELEPEERDEFLAKLGDQMTEQRTKD